MVGLDIEVKNEYDSYLKKIFQSLNLKMYDWEIFMDETICCENGKLTNGLFKPHLHNKNFLNGNDFDKLISKNSYYMIFVDIHAYPRNAKRTNIRKYQDFVESECQIILMCVDVSFIEIYCKDKEILNVIYENCKEHKFDSVKFVSMEQAKNRGVRA